MALEIVPCIKFERWDTFPQSYDYYPEIGESVIIKIKKSIIETTILFLASESSKFKMKGLNKINPFYAKLKNDCYVGIITNSNSKIYNKNSFVIFTNYNIMKSNKK